MAPFPNQALYSSLVAVAFGLDGTYLGMIIGVTVTAYILDNRSRITKKTEKKFNTFKNNQEKWFMQTRLKFDLVKRKKALAKLTRFIVNTHMFDKTRTEFMDQARTEYAHQDPFPSLNALNADFLHMSMDNLKWQINSDFDDLSEIGGMLSKSLPETMHLLHRVNVDNTYCSHDASNLFVLFVTAIVRALVGTIDRYGRKTHNDHKPDAELMRKSKQLYVKYTLESPHESYSHDFYTQLIYELIEERYLMMRRSKNEHTFEYDHLEHNDVVPFDTSVMVNDDHEQMFTEPDKHHEMLKRKFKETSHRKTHKKKQGKKHDRRSM
jgi:hypothetical protein